MGVTTKNYGSAANTEITHDGKTQSLKAWCKYLDLDYSTVRMRQSRGKTAQDDLFHPTPKGYNSYHDQDRTSTTMPSFFYSLPHDIKVRMMEESQMDRFKMVKILEIALRHYLLEGDEK